MHHDLVSWSRSCPFCFLCNPNCYCSFALLPESSFSEHSRGESRNKHTMDEISLTVLTKIQMACTFDLLAHGVTNVVLHMQNINWFRDNIQQLQKLMQRNESEKSPINHAYKKCLFPHLPLHGYPYFHGGSIAWTFKLSAFTDICVRLWKRQWIF